MNIYGYKKKRKEIVQDLKKGIKNLGLMRYNRLLRRKDRIDYNIKRLRKDRLIKKKK